MHWKKLLINTIITVGVASPLVAMIAIGSNSRPSQASSSYLMNFDSKSQEFKYVENLKKQVAEVFTEYKKNNPNYKGLELEFITLKTTLTAGEINFFSELNKSLMAINENLSFKLTQRNPLTLKQGFYDRNVDMTSFYWSPDYNGIGSWLTYVFSEYQVPNLWPGLASLINKNTTNDDPNNWVVALRNHLMNFSFEGANGIVPIVNSATKKAITYEEIFIEGAKIKEKNPKSDWTINKVNSTIGNGVAAWANQNLSSSTGVLNNNADAMKNGLYKSFEGGFEPGTFKPSLPVEMLNYLTSFKTNLPFMQDGGNTINATLLRKGTHLPTNPNSSPNYRDYYYDPKLFNSNVFKQRILVDPFLSTISPFNPTFTKTSTTTFNTIYTPLFSWSTMGDYYTTEKPDNQGIDIKDDFKIALTSFGTSMTLDEFSKAFDALFNPDGSLINKDKSFIELPIRPIPWVNSKGETTSDKKYLSPQDFLAGFIGYGQSVQTKFNKNDYFLNLTNIDIKKTIEDTHNNARNESEKDRKTFKIHFRKKELGAKNIADILSMQYFNALPAFSQKVKNIIDPNEFKKYAVIDENGILDQNKSQMTEFYGNGAGKDPKVWGELWSASPYYISEVNDTRYIFQKNNHFFDFFNKEVSSMTAAEQPQNYESYKDEYQVNNTTVKKIPTFQITYGDNYKEQITYEQFKVGELDSSNIPTALKNEVYQTSLKENIYYAPVTKVNKSDLIPYNLQVFQTEIDGTPMFEGHNSNTEILKMLTSDKYGNIIYPKGYVPKAKTKLTPGYIDLIVNNFYTPIDGVDDNGNLLPAIQRSSSIIRTAISDCINWMSINSLISPDVTRSFQNSFFPFGVAKMNNDQTLDSRWDYWSLAAYKIGQENVELGKRLGGLIQWTLPELLQSWERQASKR